MVRRVVLGGGVPLVGPQKELRGPSVYTPRGFTSSLKQETNQGVSGFITEKSKTNKMRKRVANRNEGAFPSKTKNG